jgi:hypothetical protein
MMEREGMEQTLQQFHWPRSERPYEAVPRLFQVNPVPARRGAALAVAQRVAERFASASGRLRPEFSRDAAHFLDGRAWTLADLSLRVCRAVELNDGSLISASDLGE